MANKRKNIHSESYKIHINLFSCCGSQFLTKISSDYLCRIKYRIFNQTSSERSGKNKKYGFFLLGLKYTLRTCFDTINFLPKSCPELSNQVLSFSACQIYYWFQVRVLQSGQDFGKKFLVSKHVLKVYFKSSRKNPDVLFLPLCSVLVWLKIRHLIDLIKFWEYFEKRSTYWFMSNFSAKFAQFSKCQLGP